MLSSYNPKQPERKACAIRGLGWGPYSESTARCALAKRTQQMQGMWAGTVRKTGYIKCGRAIKRKNAANCIVLDPALQDDGGCARAPDAKLPRRAPCFEMRPGLCDRLLVADATKKVCINLCTLCAGHTRKELRGKLLQFEAHLSDGRTEEEFFYICTARFRQPALVLVRW